MYRMYFLDYCLIIFFVIKAKTFQMIAIKRNWYQTLGRKYHQIFLTTRITFQLKDLEPSCDFVDFEEPVCLYQLFL